MPALKRLRQKDFEFKGSLCYIAKPCSRTATEREEKTKNLLS
jgi:hypothetical protein